MNVIGKAKLFWNKYIEYVQRETINVKEHPADGSSKPSNVPLEYRNLQYPMLYG